MRIAGIFIFLALASSAAVADECPSLSGEADIRWDYQEGPDFGVCNAVRKSDGKQLFGVYEGHAPSFHPGSAPEAARGVVGGRAVAWYLPSPDQNAILLQTLFDVPGSQPDYSFQAHVWVLPQRRADLAQTFRLLAKMRF